MSKTVENTNAEWLQFRLPGIPVQMWLRPRRAFTGGMLPVNMCGPVIKAGCNWPLQHTPPQAPTAPRLLRQKVKQAGRMLHSKQWRKDGGGEGEGGGSVEGKKEKRSSDFRKENLDQTHRLCAVTYLLQVCTAYFSGAMMVHLSIKWK